MSGFVSPDPVVADALALYESAFAVNPKQVKGLVIASAPGRVNLIGEHTDYNDGFVFPCAIEFHTVVMGNTNGTKQFRLISSNTLPTPGAGAGAGAAPKPLVFTADTVYQPTTGGAWHNYLRGVLSEYRTLGYDLPGLDIAVCGNVPLGGGLSSSASLEVATATFLDGILGITTEGPKKALLCQSAEHKFAGVPCGIMDQFVVANAKQGHALLLDCRDRQFKLVPINDPSVSILITNSNVKHELTGGEYKQRREQCEEAVRILSTKHKNVKFLRDVNLQQLNDMQKKISNQLVYRRARHVITENERTEKAATLLPKCDYEGFGKLMTQSHVSLKNDFEVSCPEVDTLVDIALQCEGVYGSRMTGGGFGGCTVTLVKTSHVQQVIDTIKKQYLARQNKHATCFVTRPAAGAKFIHLSPSSKL